MLQVKDGSRIIQFDGDLVAESSSHRRGAERWVEFQLYRTRESGHYIISRVGVSTLYHLPDCDVVGRNSLREETRDILDSNSKPCVECRPDQSNFPMICPERPRHWAQVCKTPESVLDSVVKYDDAGGQYLTYVVRRLLEAASKKDERIADLYMVQTIR